jgi:hypothetical protein
MPFCSAAGKRKGDRLSGMVQLVHQIQHLRVMYEFHEAKMGKRIGMGKDRVG